MISPCAQSAIHVAARLHHKEVGTPLVRLDDLLPHRVREVRGALAGVDQRSASESGQKRSARCEAGHAMKPSSQGRDYGSTPSIHKYIVPETHATCHIVYRSWVLQAGQSPRTHGQKGDVLYRVYKKASVSTS